MDDDDYDDYSDEFDDFDSDGDVLDDEEEDENQLYGGDEEEYQDQEEEEEDGVEEEEEELEVDAVDGMDDYEDDEEILEYGEQLYDDEDEIVDDLEGVEIEDEVEEDLVEFDDEEDPVEFEDEEEVEEGEEEMMEEGEEDGGEGEFDEEEGDEEDDVYGNESSSYEEETEPDDEFETIVPFPTRLRSLNFEGESSYLRRDEGGFGGSRRNWRAGAYGGRTATTRPTENNVVASEAKVVESTATGSSGSNDLGWNGFQGPVCPICYENWTGEGRHCVCCLPCGHLYGLSCITVWLLRPNSQKCPQCNHVCELEDVRRLYGMQLQISGVEELQQKVKSLEAKCASLELKDADWLKKEAEWQKREADLKQRLNQHKEAEVGLVNNTVDQGDTSKRHDPVDKPEPSNALSQMKL